MEGDACHGGGQVFISTTLVSTGHQLPGSALLNAPRAQTLSHCLPLLFPTLTFALNLVPRREPDHSLC